MADIGELSLEQLLAMKKKRGTSTQFKNPSVEQEFEGVNPELQGLAMTSPEPLTVTSGMRTPETNAAVGGVPNSQHMTGNALDLRKNGDLSDSLERFKSSGYKVLDEGDHFHVEPAGYVNPNKMSNQNSSIDTIQRPISDYSLEELREMKKVNSGIPVTAPTITPAPLKGVSGNPIWTGYRHFLKSSTAGLSEPVSAGLSALTEQGIQGIDSVTKMAGEQPMLPERSIGDAYDYYRDKQRNDMAAMTEANPISSGIGEIAGIVAPGGAYNQITKALPKVIPALAKGSSTLMNIPKAAVAGGLENLAYQQIDPDAARDPASMAKDFALGGVFNTVAPVAEAVAGGAKSIAPRFINKILKPTTEDMKKGKNIGKEMIERKDVTSLQSAIEKGKKGLDENEDKLQNVLNNSENSAEPIDKEIIKQELENLKKTSRAFTKKGEEVTISKGEISKIERAKNEIDNLPDIDVSSANEIKRVYYKRLNRVFEKVKPTFNQELEMATAKGYKKAIEDRVREVAPINKELSYYGRLKDLSEEALAKSEKQGLTSNLSWKDFVLGSGAAATGHPILGGGLALGGTLLNTMPGATAGGVGLDALGNLINRMQPLIDQTKFLGPGIDEATQMFQ